MANQGPEHESPSRTFLHFTQHTLIVLACFLLILCIAIGLDQLAKFLIGHDIVDKGSPIDLAMQTGKIVLLVADVAMLLVLIVKLGWRTIRRL
jgi:hypothetical protein